MVDRVSERRSPRDPATGATLILAFGLMANLAPLMTFAAVLNQIAAAWRLSAGEAGWIGGIYFLGYAVAVPFLAGATDRFDGVRVYRLGAILAAASSLAFAVRADGFVAAMILRFLGGIGLAGVHMPGLKLLMDRLGPARQSRGAAIYTSCYAAGSAGSFVLAGLVDGLFGWNATFVAAALGPLLSVVALAGLGAAPPRPPLSRPGLLQLGPLLRDRRLMAYVIAFAGNTWEVFAVRVWFVAYLAWSLGRPGNDLHLPSLGIVSGAASLAGVPVSLAVAELAIRVGRRPVVIATCGLSVAVCLALAATAGGSAWLALILLVTVQITCFADVGALAGGVVAAADPARRGAALGLYTLIGYTSGALGPVMVGQVRDWFGGIGAASGWTAGFLIMALGSSVTAIAVYRARG